MRRSCADDICNYIPITSIDGIRVLTPKMEVFRVIGRIFDGDDIIFKLENGERYSYKELGYYAPCHDGAVIAVRIYNKDGYQPMATLAFAFGGTFTFQWDRTDIRAMFADGINAYTLFYDTRCIDPFTSVTKTPSEDFGWSNFSGNFLKSAEFEVPEDTDRIVINDGDDIMILYRCNHCGHLVQSSHDTCPHCGRTIIK